MTKNVEKIIDKILMFDNMKIPNTGEKEIIFDIETIISKGGPVYQINNNFIDLMQSFSDIVTNNETTIDLTSFEILDNTRIIYELRNDKIKYKKYGISPIKLFSFIKLNMHFNNIGKKNIFTDLPYNSLIEFSFNVKEFVICNSDNLDNIAICRKKLYQNVKRRDKIENKDCEIFEEKIEPIIDYFIDYVSSCEKHSGYIYNLLNIKNNKSLIFGSPMEIDKIRMIKYFDNNKILNDFEYDDLKLILLENYNAPSIIHYILKIDFHKCINKSIVNGYNDKFCIEGINNLFEGKKLTNVNKNIIVKNITQKINSWSYEKMFNDDIDYTNIYSYVYQIRNKTNDKRFFGITYDKTLKDVVKEINNMIPESLKYWEYQKIHESLKNEPMCNFEFDIVKTKLANDYSTNLTNEKDKLILEYDSINNGYNSLNNSSNLPKRRGRPKKQN